ncbi:DUF1592 domain-containing protein [Rhodopirellula halodulae]|uniref:DUF1592 domain-containing protein n=1 Tax=Rhodopirellula halodulae TaxID=2894198 RepID=UPI001E3EAA6E|nr:DUF1592 domain-containing protein [Rhodopirellula sp. JC737]MCC9655975.1 DUF1592 domain-containing protein [Rhodopirellula sp. JC737]
MSVPRIFLLLLASIGGVSVFGDDPLESTFQQTVQPFLRTHCVECHDSDSAQGDLDLTTDQNVDDVVGRFRHWAVVLERLRAGDMPPEDAGSQPSDEQRQAMIRWIETLKQAEAKRTAGDPGLVLARRLSSAEYNRTIRDLTGVDIQPAADFPIDPANEAGFDNSGESLTMSPALLKKYLQAARRVADHLAITPSGLEFAPHPVITETDRDKFCVNRIIAFYRQQNVRLEDHLFVVWKAHTDDDQSISQLANTHRVSQRYCHTLHDALANGSRSPADDETLESGPMTALRAMWSEVIESSSNETEARESCQQMATFIEGFREQLVPEIPNLTAPQMNPGSQPLVLWKNRQFAANRRRLATKRLQPLQERIGSFDASDLSVPAADQVANLLSFPETEKPQESYVEELKRFCNLFPDRFFVSERARVYLDAKDEKKRGRTGRYLSAGFHSQMGYYRDDAPLYDLMLTDEERTTLDRLWVELDFVTSAPMRQYAGFIWFDRTDSKFMRDRVFDRYRAEDKDCIAEDKVRGLCDAYVAKAEKVGASDKALAAIRRYFDDMSKTFRSLETLKQQSQPVQLEAVLEFAERAYRRPLTNSDREEILSFYQHLRTEGELDHDESIRDCVVRILMSPHFCYRIDPASSSQDGQVQPLDGHSLANRLSYFLWSSMPDEPLMELAAQNALQDAQTIARESRRMLRDPKSHDFIREFMGNWLNFRRFDQHNGVDRERFPQFTDSLRLAMLEEPLRFFADVVSNDRSILDFLYANHTFVNRELAEHYGVTDAEWDTLVSEAGASEVAEKDRWTLLPEAGRWNRGGLLPMGVFLTRNSPGLRTSPVQRGNWVVQRVLGEHVPAPPAEVPELPEDESKLGDLTIREALARHREHPSCAGCHERIDSMGLVFEEFGPIGELRDRDLGGRKIDAKVVFPDGSHGDGIDGLKDYIRRQRENDFVDHFCRKLLAFALGRSLQLSDESLIADMKTNLRANQHRFDAMVDTIVTSPAFRNKRVQMLAIDSASPHHPPANQQPATETEPSP